MDVLSDTKKNKQLAVIFIDHALRVTAKDHVVIMTSDLSHVSLIQACYAAALDRGAQVYLDVAGFNLLLDRTSVADLPRTFYEHANTKQLRMIPTPQQAIVEWGTAFLRLTAVDDPTHLQKVSAEKIQIKARAYRSLFDGLINKKWVLTYLPTAGFAKQAGMSLKKLSQFYYDSVLVDYDTMKQSLRGLSDAIDVGSTVRIKGYKTDLQLGIKGRTAQMCYGEKNIPDGEVFTGPEETKTNGYIYYDFPGLYAGKIMEGIYLEFKQGKVVTAKAKKGQKDLEKILGTDPGAKRLGEFAIGANYGIQDYMYSTLFDEKMGGTIHTALGRSYEDERGWGKNKSAIHWDIVKDMRKPGSVLTIDETVVLKDGVLLV